MLESHRCSMPDLCPDHAAQSRGSPGPVTGAEHMWVPGWVGGHGEFTGIPGGAPCTRSPSSHARPAIRPKPRDASFSSLGPAARGEPGHSRKRGPRVGMPVLGGCPALDPGRGCCAGRQALPWAQTGAPTPWLVFCWSCQRRGKTEVRRDSWDPRDARPPPRDSQAPNGSLTELLPGRL